MFPVMMRTCLTQTPRANGSAVKSDVCVGIHARGEVDTTVNDKVLNYTEALERGNYGPRRYPSG